jgi:hypothetical protein
MTAKDWAYLFNVAFVWATVVAIATVFSLAAIVDYFGRASR